MSSRYVFPQGRIEFKVSSAVLENVQPSPQFLNAVDSAMAKSTLLEQREGLYEVFEEFGHVFRTKVQIGGVLSAHTGETFQRSVRCYHILEFLASH